MPLWTIHHSAGVYSDDDKQALAAAIVQLYPILPKFYVGTAFHEHAPSTLFIGGKPVENFVRISVDHIARQFSDEALVERWLGMVGDVFRPFTTDRGLDWELHIDETPFKLWLIQGKRPPLPNTEQEKLWMAENRPVVPAQPAQ